MLVVLLAGVGVGVVAVLPGLAAAIVGELVFGAAAAAAVTTAVALRRVWVGRADDDTADYPQFAGPPAVLTGRGAGLDTTPGDAIATVEHGASALGALHLHGWAADSDPHTPRTVTARVDADTLDLQHRRGGPADAADPGDVLPDVVLRLVDQRGHPTVGAHVHRHGDLEDWTVPVDGHVLRFRVDPRRRPTRRTLLDTTTRAASCSARAFRVRIVRPTRRLTFDPPDGLSPAAMLLCLWLVHLLDAHARAHTHWPAVDDDWTTVDDDFPLAIGPGGFGDPRPAPLNGGSGGAGMGS